MRRQISALIDFNGISSHDDLLAAMISLTDLERRDALDLEIDLNGLGLIYPDLLLLLVARVEGLKKKGVEVNCSLVNFVPNSSRVNYASRINFFEFLGINLEEGFIRRDRQGRFIEISAFNDKNIYRVFDEIEHDENVTHWYDYQFCEIPCGH